MGEAVGSEEEDIPIEVLMSGVETPDGETPHDRVARFLEQVKGDVG